MPNSQPNPDQQENETRERLPQSSRQATTTNLTPAPTRLVQEEEEEISPPTTTPSRARAKHQRTVSFAQDYSRTSENIDDNNNQSDESQAVVGHQAQRPTRDLKLRHSISNYAISGASGAQRKNHHQMMRRSGSSSNFDLHNRMMMPNTIISTLVSNNSSVGGVGVSGMNSARTHVMTKQEEVQLRNEFNSRRENFETVDFFSTINDEESDDEDDEEDDDTDEEDEEDEELKNVVESTQPIDGCYLIFGEEKGENGTYNNTSTVVNPFRISKSRSLDYISKKVSFKRDSNSNVSRSAVKRGSELRGNIQSYDASSPTIDSPNGIDMNETQDALSLEN